MAPHRSPARRVLPIPTASLSVDIYAWSGVESKPRRDDKGGARVQCAQQGVAPILVSAHNMVHEKHIRRRNSYSVPFFYYHCLKGCRYRNRVPGIRHLDLLLATRPLNRVLHRYHGARVFREIGYFFHRSLLTHAHHQPAQPASLDLFQAAYERSRLRFCAAAPSSPHRTKPALYRVLFYRAG